MSRSSETKADGWVSSKKSPPLDTRCRVAALWFTQVTIVFFLLFSLPAIAADTNVASALLRVNDSKNAIKAAINFRRPGALSDHSFRTYPDAVYKICTTEPIPNIPNYSKNNVDDALALLADTKAALYSRINTGGVAFSADTPLDQYAEKISQIQCLPSTMNAANCPKNIPLTKTQAEQCLGMNDTAGHWQLVSSIVSDSSNKFIKVGSVPPGLYRVESHNADPTYNLGSLVILVDSILYYAHSGNPDQATSRMFFSITSPFVVGSASVACNWDARTLPITCYLNRQPSISLEDNIGEIDWIGGKNTPGITAANTETPVRSSAIYRWVN